MSYLLEINFGLIYELFVNDFIQIHISLGNMCISGTKYSLVNMFVCFVLYQVDKYTFQEAPIFRYYSRSELLNKNRYLFLTISDSFTILGLWVLGLAVSYINEPNCKLMSPEHYF